MDANIGNVGLRRRKAGLARLKAAAFLLLPLIGYAKDALVDQAVATVGSQVITLHEVEVAVAVQEAIDAKRPFLAREIRSDRDLLEATRGRLVERLLIRNYLVSTGFLSHFSKDEVEDVKRKIKAVWGDQPPDPHWDEASVGAAIEGIVRETWFRDSFLAGRVITSDFEVRAYYEKKKESRFLGKALESVENLVKADLRKEKIREEYTRWLETERRRTEVALLPLIEGIPSQ